MAPPSIMFVEEFDPKRKSKARAHAAKERYRKLRQEIYSKTSAKNIVGNRLSIPDRRLPSPIDLGSGFSDPFASYALVLSHDEHRLVYHYATLIPSLFRKYWQHHVGNIILATDLFQLYTREPASLRAMLFEAACHRAILCDLPYPIEYENLAIHEIVHNLECPTVGTILATGLLANIKRRSNQPFLIHWRAAQQMITNHGGLLSFRYDPLLFTKHTWNAIALSGSSHGLPDEPDDGEAYEKLHDLIVKRKAKTLKILPTSQAEVERQDDSIRVKAFKNQTELKRLLKYISESIADYEEAPSVKESCRMAIVIFLTSAMEDTGDFAPATKAYLESVTKHLDRKTDDSALSPEHLLWSLIRLSFLYPESNKCIEFWVSAVDMTAAWKRLRVADRQAMQVSLWASLELPEMVEGSVKLALTRKVPISTPWSLGERTVPKDCFCELLWFTIQV
ncbi:hypothetical protein K505DRAFT_414633 [Melanomma pulvis-pyrius CBS 109.77]|uniref:Uncharacterized protein n=1 Tax=Melanomma pulvis-pyrius CBS 109.77 TaxID=1314802 RepID=A0A6A6XPI0_9PLEO|nr:hypothetical protein K505DRAFT_414633 [Melanomma pulvis-pyrius CBS 109.77]